MQYADSPVAACRVRRDVIECCWCYRALLPFYDYLQACTLHLLDIDWQLYDLAFIVDVKLPQLYMDLARGSVSMPEKVTDDGDVSGGGGDVEAREIADYKRNVAWLADCRHEFLRWYDRVTTDSKSQEHASRDVQMFVARYCDLLDVEISCDGCGNTLPGRRYRCLQCKDMDLCSTCFAGAVSFKVHMHFYECQICYHLHLCINFTVFLSV